MNLLRDIGVPRLKEIAAAEGRPAPALCPRISLQISREPTPGDKRVAGQGSVEQIRPDLLALESMGSSYVIFDTYSGNPDSTKDLDTQFKTLEAVANRIVDLERQKVREIPRP